MPPHAAPPVATGSLPWAGGWRHPALRAGIRDMVTPQLGIAAWALVTGVAMVKGGLGVPLALLMSLTVFAGSAQLAALPLLAAGAPLGVLWATALCVNLRFVIFSAGWRPIFLGLPLRLRLLAAYLAGDVNYVLCMQQLERRPIRPEDPAARDEARAYFAGTALTNYLFWQGASITGILLADRIPSEWGLGFAGTLALFGLLMGLVRDWATGLAAGAAGLAAVAAHALPFRLNIVTAIFAAVALGLLAERLVSRPAGPGPQ
ncbi:AzlC family ABC transporter permease [Aquariibacter albus]|uniref:AzlC family ABC transporter permease n=1 Tax=Aquariibacter albus TaxID=2759899 RepID=A0A839HS41_9BURK|nr:AzlC family ABC transporter permease [Aquariibacter albus]MBB1161931.1 AzlC family ABC transporter permease [Aquariibacter albus]